MAFRRSSVRSRSAPPSPTSLPTAGILTLGLLAGCATSPDPGLGGTSWQLVEFQGGDETILTPDDRTKYTIAFGTDGRVTARIDCNRGSGTWASEGPNHLVFGPLALTRAQCPPGSLHDRIVRDWEYVRSYVIEGGHMFVSLMADAGIYEFEPMRAP